MSTSVELFPDHLIPNDQKGFNWILQYCKAAWSSFEEDTPKSIFFHNRYNYELIKQYAMGNQSISKYKPILGVDEEATETWLNIDWSVIPIIPKFRRIALQKMGKMAYNIVATPVDSLANEETDDYFANAKAKILLREEAKKIDPSLLDMPALRLTEKEAKDLEELEIQMSYTFKHQMAIEAEQAIKLVFEQNKIDKLRDEIRASLFDYGVAGYKEYIDSNGAIKIRVVNPRMVISSYCRNNDFGDTNYVGEVLEMTIADLKQMAGNQFSEEQYEEIARKHFGQFGNPLTFGSSTSIYNRPYDKFRIRILDIQFYSVNQMVYEKRVDRRGNKIYAKARFEDRNKRKDKFDRVAYKVVYKAKWVMGSNMMFDYGLNTDMKRAKSSLMDTTLDFHLFAPEFWDMKAYGMMEQLIPIADAIQIAWYRLQNAINQARPKGIMIEMGALEDIPLGKGGKKLTPMEVLDLYNKTGALIYRKADAQGRMTNYKPIEELENGLGSDILSYWQIIQNNIQLIRDITGMNEFTDGSTPDPRSLTTIAKLANEGTNNSLGTVIVGEKRLLEEVASDVILRLQDVVQKGEVRGYIRSLGSNTMNFIKVHPNIALHEYGIFLEDKPTDEQRAMLLQELSQYKQTGLIMPEDAFMIENTDNLKVAQQILAYKIKKRKEENQAYELSKMQENGRIQQESAVVAEQAKQQTFMLESKVKKEVETLKGTVQKELLNIKYGWEMKLKQLEMTGKIVTKEVENKGKKDVKKIDKGLPSDEDTQQSQLPPIEEEDGMNEQVLVNEQLEDQEVSEQVDM